MENAWRVLLGIRQYESGIRVRGKKNFVVKTMGNGSAQLLGVRMENAWPVLLEMGQYESGIRVRGKKNIVSKAMGTKSGQ